MKKIIYLLTFYLFSNSIFGQTSYFPPLAGTTWDTVSMQSLRWCPEKVDSLYQFLQTTNTKAFIVLKDGRIVLEKYFGTFTRDSNWYWASAGKSLTAVMVGIAQQEGYLKISDSTFRHLGRGWSSLTTAQEEKITIRHHLTMTTGLNDAVADSYCTLPSCLQYAADPGTRWAYHNGAYTLLDTIIEASTQTNYNLYVATKLKAKIGMDGISIRFGYNRIFASTARSMARFGLMIANKGKWANNVTVLSDTNYFKSMVNTSQQLNRSYGYLWWLNGKSSLMLPQLRNVFNVMLAQDAPPEMFAAMGKNGQLINIVPSQGLVWVRIGDNPDNSLVPTVYNNDIWKKLNPIMCGRVPTEEQNSMVFEARIVPNPVNDHAILMVDKPFLNQKVLIVNMLGQLLHQYQANGNRLEMDFSNLPVGIYQVVWKDEMGLHQKKFFKSDSN
jgi:CubicO group peptidase (beta-lactamase class C family)